MLKQIRHKLCKSVHKLSEVDKCGIKLICSFNFNNEISGIALNGAKALYGAIVYVESMPTAKYIHTGRECCWNGWSGCCK